MLTILLILLGIFLFLKYVTIKGNTGCIIAIAIPVIILILLIIVIFNIPLRLLFMKRIDSCYYQNRITGEVYLFTNYVFPALDKVGTTSPHFSGISDRQCIGKSDTYVYVGLKVLEGADPKTVQVLNPQNDRSSAYNTVDDVYIKDAQSVFYDDRVIPGADGASFQTIPGYCWYTMDKSHVYYAGRMIEGFHPQYFERVYSKNHALATRYAKDTFSNSVYNEEKKLPMDGNTFKLILESEDLRLDKDHAFWGESDITNLHIDPDSFELVGSGVAKDKHHVYDLKHIKILEGADPVNFRFYSKNQFKWKNGQNDFLYGNGKQFYAAETLKLVGPDEFELIK